MRHLFIFKQQCTLRYVYKYNVWYSIVLVSYICVCRYFLACITGLDVLDNILFLMELMVEHVSRRIQFGLMMLVVGASFVIWVMVSSTCGDCDPIRVLDVDYEKFIA